MGNIYFAKSGISPQGGPNQVLYTDPSLYREGTRRIKSSRQNATFDVIFTTIGETIPDVKEAERVIGLYETRAKLYWEQNIGQVPMFRYRVADGLRHLPDPIVGEWAEYYIIKEVKLRRPTAYADMLPAGVTEKLIAQLVCEPSGRGNPERAGRADTFYQDPLGRFWLCGNKNNVVANPSFGHPSPNHLYGTNLIEGELSPDVVHYLDPDDYWSGEASLVLITDSNKPEFVLEPTFTTLTGNVGSGWIVKRTDGGEVDSSVVTCYFDDDAATTTWYRQIPDTDWWMVMAARAGVTGGIPDLRVQPGQAIKVDYMWYGQLDSVGYPHGFLPLDCDSPGALHHVSGNTAYLVAPTTGTSRIRYSMDEVDFVRDWSISFHATILGSAAAGQGVANTDFIEGALYGLSVNMYLRYNGSTARWEIHRLIDGVWHVGTSNQTTIIWGSKHHLIVTEIGSTIKVYDNGTLIITLADLPAKSLKVSEPLEYWRREMFTFQPGGFSWALDGVKIWQTGLNAAEVSLLTSNEAEMDQVQPPLYISSLELASSSAYNIFDGRARMGWDVDGSGNVNTSNGLMIGNLPGNDAADYEIKLLPSYLANPIYIYGIAVDAPPSFTQLRAFSEKYAVNSADYRSALYSMNRYTAVAVTATGRTRYYPQHYQWLRRFRRNVHGEYQLMMVGEMVDNATLEALVSQYATLSGGVALNSSLLAARQGKTFFPATATRRIDLHTLSEIALPQDRADDEQRVLVEVIGGGQGINGTLDVLYLLPLDNMAKLSRQADEAQATLTFKILVSYFHLTADNCWIKVFRNLEDSSQVYNQFRYEYDFGSQPKLWPGYTNFLCFLNGVTSISNYDNTQYLDALDLIVTPRYL